MRAPRHKRRPSRKEADKRGEVIMTTPELELDLRASIRTIPDYPSPGIMFRDITTLLRKIGAEVLAACFIIDLPELGGAAKLRALDVPVRTLISFEGH